MNKELSKKVKKILNGLLDETYAGLITKGHVEVAGEAITSLIDVELEKASNGAFSNPTNRNDEKVELFTWLRSIICNGTTDCENYPECPENTDGCVVHDAVCCVFSDYISKSEVYSKIFPIAQKFINKVETGMAISKETYADMKAIKEWVTSWYLPLPEKEKKDD